MEGISIIIKPAKKRNLIFLTLEIIIALFVIFYLYFSFKGDFEINFVVFFLVMSLFSLIRTFETRAKSNLIVFSIYVVAAIIIFLIGTAS